MSERENTVKRLPFVLDRKRHAPLIAQIVDGVRQAVQTGVYKPGSSTHPPLHSNAYCD